MSGFDILGPGGAGGVQKPYAAEQLFGDKGPGKVGETDQSEEFISHLNDALMNVRELQLETRDQARGLASGEPVEVHDLMVSMGKSEIAFNMMLEVRNKLLDAWQTLRRSVS